ncbi:TPA: hypothetical protein N0F65_005765 [Lagenidium giganteum]|uniref:Uncharacterized protein n=1 Tax=Lagenidium giganteum TaxID=4803 RepID=A0AAV2YQ26_9STRA|nr:TPA: hypothetical protein N0F65_005765 [Lagenidium giganteum]
MTPNLSQDMTSYAVVARKSTTPSSPSTATPIPRRGDTMSGNDEECNVFDESWKTHRKLKHQRDLGKRYGSRAKQLHAQHVAADRSRALDISPLKLRVKPVHDGHHPHDRTAVEGHGRSIPTKKKERFAFDGLPVSKSLPIAAVSWPPTMRNHLNQADENSDPNYRADSELLATSAPNDSTFLRRELRQMTLFESAMIYNESGDLLSHDDFHELGSSPEAHLQRRRKHKRRVGRRKVEKKKQEAQEGMTHEEIVLELMCFLLPDVEVTKELNLLLLGGNQHKGDMFELDEDQHVPHRQAPSTATALEVDLIKFQSGLSSLVRDIPVSTPTVPTAGTSGAELAELTFSTHFVSQAALQIVMMDLARQYECFAVLLAMYRVMESKRQELLESITSASLAIYQHQAVDTGSPLTNVKVVSMKGVLAFVAAVLGEMQQEKINEQDDFLDESDDASESDALCREVMQSLKLLMRSSPGQPARGSDNQELDKYSEDSESAEATTYAAIGEILMRMVSVAPMHGESMVSWMVHKWPQRSVQLQLFYVRFLGGMLVQYIIMGYMVPYELVERVFSRFHSSIKSAHFMLAKEATDLCSNMHLVHFFLARDQCLREKIASALHDNAVGHWNQRIREMSDQYFDMLLDFA